jgi:hypothetical protein
MGHLSTSCEVPLALQEGSTTYSSPNTINVPKGITISKRSVSNTYSPLHKDQYQRPVGISRSLTNSPAAKDNFAFPRQQAASSVSPSSLFNLPGITVSSGGGQRNRSSTHFNQLATAGSTQRFRKQSKSGNETVISLSEKSPPQRSNSNFEFRCQFHQRSISSFFSLRSAEAHKVIDDLTVFFALLESVTVKAASKTLVKSTSGVSPNRRTRTMIG